VPDAQLIVNRNRPPLVSALLPGVTFTQHTFGNATALAAASAHDVLAHTSQVANQHVMGWGTQNPWPTQPLTASEMLWASLDARVEHMRAAGQQIILTLCFRPLQLFARLLPN